MSGHQQPFLYDVAGQDRRSPTRAFDPKAVTRASYTPKPEKPKPDGPLLSFNRHPDAHMIIGPRFSNLKPMSTTTKKWIVALRNVQLLLRVLELNGALGVFILMILVSNIDQLFGWVMRITPGVVVLHCGYAIYHLSRSAGGRTPGSSAAYHVFAGVSDLCVLPIYAYGVLTIRSTGTEWTTILSNQKVMTVFIPALYYTLIAAGGVHVVSLCLSLWLGVMFRRISQMPPDLNPLEDRFTSRAHKRNKSSVATASTNDSEKRLFIPLEERRRSGAPYETLSRPPSIPFMHTRQGSELSLQSRDSRTILPSRQSPAFAPPRGMSPRSSVNPLDLNLYSAGLRGSNRGSYTEIPLHDSDSSRPSSATLAGGSVPSPHSRTGKFTEAWYASESLISRTQQRNRAMMKTASNNGSKVDVNANANANANNNSPKATASPRRTYEALSQRYDFPVSEESDSDHDEDGNESGGDENYRLEPEDAQKGYGTALAARQRPPPQQQQPSPLRSHPFVPPRAQTPHRPNRSSALSEVTLSDRNVSAGSHDIADASDSEAAPVAALASSPIKTRQQGAAAAAGNRLSSIQPEAAFYSRPYGELTAATPPIMVGSNRQVSSGTDFEGAGRGGKGEGGGGGAMFGRRNVSGKIAEEGRVSEDMRRSRYSVLNI